MSTCQKSLLGNENDKKKSEMYYIFKDMFICSLERETEAERESSSVGSLPKYLKQLCGN